MKMRVFIKFPSEYYAKMTIRPIEKIIHKQSRLKEDLTTDERFIYHPAVQEKLYISIFTTVFGSIFLAVCLVCAYFFIFNLNRLVS